jgi:hypothetical protein
MNIYLRERLNTRVYVAPVDRGEILLRCIVDDYQTIRNSPAIYKRKLLCMMRRVKARIESHVSHFKVFVTNLPFQL